MATVSLNRIAKLRFREPVRNLPNYYTSDGIERKFTYQFAKAYVSQFQKLHRTSDKNQIAVAREIPANGYGIADLVTVSWKSRKSIKTVSAQEFIAKRRPTTRAFEVKIYDWRKALMQANRYRFFSHTPIVVMPTSNVKQALNFLQTFRLLAVGLWSFDIETTQIIRHFTPRPSRPIDFTQHLKVLSSVAKANRGTKALPIS